MIVTMDEYRHFSEFLETARKTLKLERKAMSVEMGTNTNTYHEMIKCRYPIGRAGLVKFKHKVLKLVADHAITQGQ